MKEIFEYIGAGLEAWSVGGVFPLLFVVVAVAHPYFVFFCIHPSIFLETHAMAQGMTIPSSMTLGMLIIGELYALLYLAALSLFQLGIVVMIYRRAQFYIPLWPVAFVIAAIEISIWWLVTGHFDALGGLIGFSIVSATVACHGIAQKWGADFCFGDDRPQYQ